MPYLAENILAVWQRHSESYVVEHHPHTEGMRYLLRVVGGSDHGIEIHCPTKQSAMRLLDELIACRLRYANHPFLAKVV